MSDVMVADAPDVLLELGNAEVLVKGREVLDRGGAPSVTGVRIPGTYSFDPNVDVVDLQRHVEWAALHNDAITQRPGDEALIAMLHIPGGAWYNHSKKPPLWVHSPTHPAIADALARLHGIPLGKPEDVEETHWTQSGPPGVGPWIPDLKMLVVNSGLDIIARALGGGLVASISGHSTTAPGATTYTFDDQSAPGSTSQWNGMRVYATSSTNAMVWGIIKSNTNASPPVATIDRWYTAATPGGAAGSTPAAGPYAITDGAPPAWFMALNAASGTFTPNATDTSLAAEYTTASGGYLRKICVYGHSAGASTFTLTPVFTGNASDTYPSTFNGIGVFVSMVVGDTVNTMLAETALNANATVGASGDAVTVTETVTI